MSVRWIVATANPHKVGELAALFAGLGVTLVAKPPGVTMPEETGTTFLANARLKARAVAAARIAASSSTLCGFAVATTQRTLIALRRRARTAPCRRAPSPAP